MRTLAASIGVVLAVSAPQRARADDCAGEAASSSDCNATGKRGAMSISVGWLTESFDPTGRKFEITHAGFVSSSGSVDGSSLRQIWGEGGYLNIRVHMSPRWYFGIHGSLTWADVHPAGSEALQPALPSGAPIVWTGAFVGTIAMTAGVRLPLGRVSLRTELVGGVRDASLRTDSSASSGIIADAYEAVLVPRIAVDLWLHKYWVLDAFAGVNALDRSEQLFGLGFAFHSQAFDGGY